MSMSMTMIDAVKEYQCPGCMYGPSAPKCSKFELKAAGCANHSAGTTGMGTGSLALGLPKGFCRFGPSPLRRIDVYESVESMLKAQPNLNTIFSLPVWKHLDKEGNTVMRWFSPRTNSGWSLVILGDQRERFSCQEVNQEDVDGMD